MKTAIVCMAKDEEHYIDEWIDYHHLLGFDDFYIYRDNWNVMTEMMKQDFCHIFDVKDLIDEHSENFPHNLKLLKIYGKALNKIINDYDFAAVIDVDEFINLKKHKSIKEFLENYNDVHGIALNWFLFGDSGLSEVKDNNYSCIDRFVYRAKHRNGCIKTIYNLKKIKLSNINLDGLVAVHSLNNFNEVTICTADRSFFLALESDAANCWVSSASLYDLAYINHYIVKTFNEFKVKHQRNITSTWYQQNKHKWNNIEEYFLYSNYNEVFDDSLKKQYAEMVQLRNVKNKELALSKAQMLLQKLRSLKRQIEKAKEKEDSQKLDDLVLRNEIKIDYTVTYLDPTDPYWQEQFKPYAEKQKKVLPERYDVDGINWLKYHFRGLAKNMPWIDTVHLVVFSESQVPDWVNRDMIKVITDDMYIPKQFLPTFNTSTKQMHLQFIPGLKEHFLFADDDLIPINPMWPSLFFDIDGHPKSPCLWKQKVKKPTNNWEIWPNVLYNSVKFAHDMLNVPYDEDCIVSPTFYHLPHPALKSEIMQYYEQHKEFILSTITPCRNAKNVIGVSWCVANWLKYKKIEPTLKVKEIQWWNRDKELDILKYWNNKTSVLNINSNNHGDLYVNLLETIFPDKCKYEK